MKQILSRIYRVAMISIIVSGLIFMLLSAFGIVTVVRGHGSSMEPNLSDGELYLMVKIRPEKIKRGDVIGAVLEDGTRVTKRVIALPRESFYIDASYISIEGDWLAEKYLEYPGWNDLKQYDTEMTLKKNEFYLMGDNRRGGTWCGVVTGEQIIGKVVGK